MWTGIERRYYMPNGFKPSTAFEGYVVAKLEAVSDRLSALPCKEDSDRLRKVEQDISNIQGKASILGALAGLISGVLAKIFLGK